MLLLSLLLLLQVLLLFSAAVAVAVGAAVADEDSSRQTPNPANLGVGPDVSGHDHTLLDGARSATATKGRFGRHRKNNKTTILLHRIAIFGLECDLNKMQDRLRSKGKPFEFIEDSY